MTTGLPPGPRGAALVQMTGFLLRPVPFLERCRARYGDPFTIRLLELGDQVFTADPEVIRDVLTGDQSRFDFAAAAGALVPLMGERSVLTIADPDEHIRERRIMLPPFHGDLVARYGALVEEATDRAIDGWPVGEPVSLLEAMRAVTLEVMMRGVFGLAPGPRSDRLGDAMLEVVDALRLGVWALPFLRREDWRWTPWARFVALRTEADALLFEEISHRRADPDLAERTDIFSALVQARYEDGGAMTDTDLRDALVTLLAAGYQTTATGTAWAFERLLRDRARLDRLRADLEAGEERYLDAVVKETLRLRPPAPYMRRVTKVPYEIDGHVLPAGTTIVTCLWLMHRSPRHFDRPAAFRPERWLDGGADDGAYLPFGAGVHRCIGAAFAQHEMKIAIRRVIERVDLAASDPAAERTTRHAILFIPAGGAEAIVRSRRPAVREPAAL